MLEKDQGQTIPALVVKQWLQEWDDVKFSKDPKKRRQELEHFFYLFALSARDLRKLSNVYRRKADGLRVADSAVQRVHDQDRSAEIGRFVKGGFPWSEVSKRQKGSEEIDDLRMPSWLPTAIIANILPPGAQRDKSSINDEDLIRVEREEDGKAILSLPNRFRSKDWNPIVPPLEIIDGQHRLWSFTEDDNLDGDMELPVVAFYNLDVTWQAYLFYTINIKPKRINTSLAFDLYPLLRIQDWLEKSPGGLAVYRETRAQELTEVLWSYSASPWHQRISMLGDTKAGPVTQAAFIRFLISTLAV